TVNCNCASGMEAITSAAQLLVLDEAQTVVAGGTESMSRVPLLFNEEATSLLLRLGRAKTLWQRLSVLAAFRLRHLKPVIALEQGLTDPVSGLIMGATAEVLAEEFHISREEQDAIALLSHQRATAAQKDGFFREEIVPVPSGPGRNVVTEDV